MRDQPSPPRTRLSTVSRATLAMDGQAPRPEAQGGHLLDRLARKLGGGVPLQRKRHVVPAHPAAVVDHFDAVYAAAARRIAIRSRPASIAFLDQLLQRAGRSFHHLACRDSVYQMFREPPY
jgi:hypothetical protein